MKAIFRWIIYKCLGWKKVGDLPKDLPKYLIIAAPHTSNWDFLLAMAFKFAEDFPAQYIGKASLFRPPYGFFFRWLGGMPVIRDQHTSNVAAVVKMFKERKSLILGMSPEGTRKKVSEWKTGFYYIAKGADIPLVLATLNFKDKEIKVSKPYYLTDDQEQDFAFFYHYFKGVEGKIAAYS